MITSRNNVVGMDAAILMHPKVWEASGHVENFHDPLVDNKISKKRYRLDHLLEDQSEDVIASLIKKLGIKEGTDQEATIQGLVSALLENTDASGAIIIESGVIDPYTKETGEWTNTRQFNLMFKTHIGPVADSSSVAYLRPETAQGIFVNYLNIQSTSRQKLPFGIAQIGKAFRNEITTGNFIFRTREFEQMEMEFFCHPDKTEEWLDYWKEERLNWFKSLGINPDKLRSRAHGKDEMAHYSSACYDIEYKFDFGWSELEGIADRGTYDLDQHMKYSNKKLTYFDQKNNKHFVPAVVEASAGVDRAMLTILADAFSQEEVNGENRTVMKFSPKMAPIKVAVFPLMNKLGMPELAEKIVDDLRNNDIASFYDTGGSIGKRYRRQDEAGTPFGLTVDHDTLEDNTITLRDRDTMEQERISVDKVVELLKAKL
jgi:glycyl-tRNA synthetase